MPERDLFVVGIAVLSLLGASAFAYHAFNTWDVTCQHHLSNSDLNKPVFCDPQTIPPLGGLGVFFAAVGATLLWVGMRRVEVSV
jgi:hypothetical protein